MQPSIWGGAHGLVVDGLGDVVAVKHVRVGLDEQVGHEVHDVAAGKVRARVLVVGLGEALDEVLEDVAHVHGADLVGRHVRLRLAEVADHLVEQRGIWVGEAFDLVVELHAREDILHVVREPVDVVLEVALDVLRVGLERLEGEFRGVVEGVAGGIAQKAVLDIEGFDPLRGVENLLVSGQKAVVEALDDGHGQDDQAVLVRLVQAAQRIGDAPDKRCLFLDIDPYRFDKVVTRCHALVPFKIGSFRQNNTSPCSYRPRHFAPHPYLKKNDRRGQNPQRPQNTSYRT